MTIYVYYIDICSSIQLPQPHRRQMEKPLGRKRKLSKEEEDNLKECLAVPNVAESRILKIWNIAGHLRKNACEVKQSQMQSLSAERLRDARACYRKWPVPETNEVVWLPCLPALLQHVVEVPAWHNALIQAHAAANGLLRPILYHDDVTCGNILVVHKVKKITAVYLSFKEMRPHVGLEAAWLPLLVIQRLQQDKIPGGLSRILAHMVKEIAREVAPGGLKLDFGDQTLCFTLSDQFLCLSDMEAQRATWSTKGSAGLKPCMFCSNIISKQALPAGDPEGTFATIASAAWQDFCPISDEDFANAAKHLATLTKRSERDAWEKAYGLAWDANSILADPNALHLLPPSLACNDVLHNYYCNGIASLEISLVVEMLQENEISLTDLRDLSVSGAWRRPRKTEKMSQTFLQRILSPKMFEGKSYKGDGTDTQPLVFMLWYVLHEKVPQKDELVPSMQSFEWLHQCSRELRFLKTRFEAIRHEHQVTRLRDAQATHQAKFTAAYGEDACLPKHHHRFHLPASALKLGFLPHCEPHEAKHRCLKSGGLVDRQKGRLAAHNEIQTHLLSRFLETTKQQAMEHGLARWELLPPTRSAAEEWRRTLSDASLICGKQIQLLQHILRVEEPLFLNHLAYVVKDCLSGDQTGIWLRLRPLRLEHMQAWGSTWLEETDDCVLYKPKSHHDIYEPVWWCSVGARFTFLY